MNDKVRFKEISAKHEGEKKKASYHLSVRHNDAVA